MNVLFIQDFLPGIRKKDDKILYVEYDDAIKEIIFKDELDKEEVQNLHHRKDNWSCCS